MRVALGVDHAGFELKAAIKQELERLGHDVLDLGTNSPEPVDYPDIAAAVGEAVRGGAAERGVLVCGSGVGACIAANKLHGIRACLCHDTYSAHQGVEHDNMNVLCLGSRIIGRELALELLRAFLGARFNPLGEERHARRVAKVAALEAHG